MAKQNLDELIEASEKAVEKGEGLDVIEAEHHGKAKEKEKKQKEKIEEKIKEKKFEKEIKVEEKVEKKVEEKKEKSKTEEKVETKKKEKLGKVKIRSKKYQQALTLIDKNRKYEIAEAMDLVKKTSYTDFDGNVEVHIRLLGKSGKPEQVRGLLQYPHPTGKKVNIAILDEKTIAEIEKTKKAPADIYLTVPALMPQVAKLAKILGPKGKMPNPKSGTIVENPEAAKKEMSGGKVEYKTDTYGNIHQVIGKVSADKKLLEENYEMLLSVLPIEKIVSITTCATMGPGIKVAIK